MFINTRNSTIFTHCEHFTVENSITHVTDTNVYIP